MLTLLNYSVKQSEVFFVDSSDEEISDDDELADEVSIDVPKSVDTTQENWNSTDYSSGFVVKVSYCFLLIILL